MGGAATSPRPRRMAISSAAMLTAISAGVTAAISRPMGAWMFARRFRAGRPGV